MKKKIYISLLASVIILAAASCKKETGEMVTMTFDAQLEGVGHKNAADTKGAADPKVYLYEGQKPYWEDGDAIRVNDGNGNVSNTTMVGRNYGRFEVSFSAGTDGPYYAVYPASMASSNLYNEQKVKLPRVQTYSVDATTGNQKINAPMFAYNPSKHVLQFHNLCGLMKITVTNDKAWDMILDSIQVEATTKKLNGVMTIGDVTSATPKLTAPTEAVDSFDVAARQYHTVSLAGINKYLRSSSLESNNAGNPDAPTSITLYVYLPTIASDAVAGNKFYIRVFSRPAWKTGSEGSTTYSADSEVHISYEMRQTASSNAYVNRNSIIPISLSLSSCKPTFTSLKSFSVSETKKVRISRGNVQYFIKNYSPDLELVNGVYKSTSASTGEWCFAPRQWFFLGNEDMHDKGNDGILVHYNRTFYQNNTWMDHFTWDSGDKPTHHRLNNSTGQAVQSDFRTWSKDWGDNFTHLSYSNGSWETMTLDEVHYLLKVRTTVDGDNRSNFGWVTITDGLTPLGLQDNNNGSKLHGILIIPDGATINTRINEPTRNVLQIVNSFNYYSSPTATTNDVATRRITDNQLTLEQFEYYEALGCIFLPCPGIYDSEGSGNDLWNDRYSPEGSYWTKTNKSTNDACTLQLCADKTLSTSVADCRTTSANISDSEKYRHMLVRLVRLYSQGSDDYKYDPFQ